METEPEPKCVQTLSEKHFRASIPRPDAGHHPASRRLINDISHQASNCPSAARNIGSPASYTSSPFNLNISATAERNSAASASEKVLVPSVCESLPCYLHWNTSAARFFHQPPPPNPEPTRPTTSPTIKSTSETPWDQVKETPGQTVLALRFGTRCKRNLPA